MGLPGKRLYAIADGIVPTDNLIGVVGGIQCGVAGSRCDVDLAAIYTFQSQQRYGMVSSLSDEGSPQSALVGIATTPDLEIVFDTLKLSRKYRNLIARPSCSMVVGWGGEQTVQIDGRAEQPEGERLERYREIYTAVWPHGGDMVRSRSIGYFVVHPNWVRYSDYDQSPPLIVEFRRSVRSPLGEEGEPPLVEV